MNSSAALRRSFLCLLVFVFFLSIAGIATASPVPTSPQNAGGVHRGVASSVGAMLEITVSLNGKAAAEVTVTISAVGGSTLASGATSSAGVYSTKVAAGTYTVSASSGNKSATKTVSVSSSPVTVDLDLSPQS